MAPKKSKMALGDFLSLGGGGTSNWADEMEDVVMPTAPGQFNPDVLPHFKRPAGGDRGDFGGRGDSFDSRPPRADVPFPDAPPYTAFVGNMSFESSADDVKDFFTADGTLTVTNVRMVTDFGGKSKGFCYAEFPEPDMLRTALGLSGSQLGGRNIRISVAEPPRAGAEGRSAGDWTRSGPLPDMPGRGGGGPQSSRGPPSSMDSGRDWGDARGSKFAPSAPASPALGSGRPPMSGRPGGSFRDVSSGSNVSAAASEDRDWSGARGGRFTPSVPPTPSASEKRPGFGNGMDRKSSDGEARDWRARPSPASPALSDNSSGVSAPVERKRLQLSARSNANASGSDPASPASTSGSRPSIFGGAAPVDTAAREQALLDARIEKERAQAEERRIKLEADAAASQAKKSANPFGAAKPVDVSAREKEVEEKLRKEKDDVNATTKAMSEAKIAEEKSANPKKEWKRPQHPNAGLTNAQASAPQSAVAKQNSSSTGSSTTQGDATKPGAPNQPRQILKNAGIRKEGFSYSNIARGSGNKPASTPPASASIVPDNVPVKSSESPAAVADNSASAKPSNEKLAGESVTEA